MKLIIDINENMYKACQRAVNNPKMTVDTVVVAIANGIPLPKGHGRLIDADALPLDDIDDANYGSNYILIAPTIIEADKEAENDK